MQAPEKKRHSEQTVIWLDHAGAHSEIGKVYHELGEWAARNKVKPAGPGFTVFLSPPSEFDPSSALFEVCIPVAPATNAFGLPLPVHSDPHHEQTQQEDYLWGV